MPAIMDIIKWTSYVLTALFGLVLAAACIYTAWHDREKKRREEEDRRASKAVLASREAVAYASVALGLEDLLFFVRPFRGESFPGSLAFGSDTAGPGSVQSLVSASGWFDNDSVRVSLSSLWVKDGRPKDERNYVAVEIGSPAWKGEIPGFSLSRLNGGRLDVMADAAVMDRDRWWPITAPGLCDQIGPYVLYIHDIDEEEELLELFGNEEFLDGITMPLGERGTIVEAVGRGVLRQGVFRVFQRLSDAPSDAEVMQVFCDTASMTNTVVKAIGGRRFRLPGSFACADFR